MVRTHPTVLDLHLVFLKPMYIRGEKKSAAKHRVVERTLPSVRSISGREGMGSSPILVITWCTVHTRSYLKYPIGVEESISAYEA